MSSTKDSGSSYKNTKQPDKCPNSSDHKHAWVRKGSWPSTWQECKYCGNAEFFK